MHHRERLKPSTAVTIAPWPLSPSSSSGSAPQRVARSMASLKSVASNSVSPVCPRGGSRLRAHAVGPGGATKAGGGRGPLSRATEATC